MPDKSFTEHMFREFVRNRMSRRTFMGTLAAAGASTATINGLLTRRAQAATPKKGGRLVIGVEAAQAKTRTIKELLDR